MQEIWTGFVIGLFGSLHCIGMCGPIAIALPFGSYKNISFYIGRIVYNLGRVITYSCFGAIFGLIGKNLSLVGFQEWTSILAGVIILAGVFMPSKFKNYLATGFPFGKFTMKLKSAFGKLFKNKSIISLLLIGIINGILPCGFVYIGLAGALATNDVLNGVFYMALFGLGTVPVMLTASIAGNFINIKIRQRLTKIIPYLAVLLAILFILRGLNLGIPYISPKLGDKNQNEHMMHHH